MAEASRNLYSILIALGFAAPLTHNLGQADATLAIAERLIALSTEQHMYFWSAIGMLARGGALAQQGEAEEAIGLIQQGLDICKAAGILCSYSYYLTYLAAAYAQSGKIDEGLAVTDEGLARCQTDLTRFHESELNSLRGDLLVLQGDPGRSRSQLSAGARCGATPERQVARAARRDGDEPCPARARTDRRSPDALARRLWVVHRGLRHPRST